MSFGLNKIEAKYSDVTVTATWAVGQESTDTVVLNGDSEEELVPGSQSRGTAMQFAWALRWMFSKCPRGVTDRVYDRLLSEVD